MPTPASPAPQVPPTRSSSWDRPRVMGWSVALLAGLLLAAYANTFQVPFLLDDDDSITANPSIRSLSTAWFPPAESGVTVSGRPLLNFSLAINHHFGGTSLFGYHAGNLLIHFAAALCLFGVVRRTLCQPALADRFGAHAMPLAWLAAALWALHPLQTGAVTYVIQRAESLAGLCYLFTLYAFIRAVGKPSYVWAIAAIVACFLGMAAKEVMASAPLVLVLYDRTFVSGSFRAAWERHHRLHLAFASSWFLLLALVIASGGRGATVGFGAVSWLEYAGTQGPGIVSYLMKAVIPLNLVFDHGAIIESRPLVIVSGLLLVLGLLAATAVLLKQRPAAGFLGAWFFLILAPSSSIIPVATQTLAEHRMYLPLAAVVVVITLACFHLSPRVSRVALGLMVLAAGVGTHHRNRAYESKLTIWEDTVRKVPDNARALNNLGSFYLEVGRVDDAISHLSRAIGLVPHYAHANANLGRAVLRKGLSAPGAGDQTGIEEGLALLQHAAELAPSDASLLSMYGNGLMDTGQIGAALPLLYRAAALAPENPDTQFDLANALAQAGRDADAERHYRVALQLEPAGAEILTNHGLLLRRMGRIPESLERLRRAAALAPASARVRSHLGVSLLAGGHTEEAMAEFTEALRLDPDWPQALYHLSNVMAQSGRVAEAIRHLESLLGVAPPTAELFSNLGVLYARERRFEEAIDRMQRAVALDPNHAPAQENLAALNAYLRSQPTRQP